MIDETFVDKLRARYPDIHPLIFHRSVERAKSETDLFDILDSFPNKYPLIWQDTRRRWMRTKDLVQISKFDFKVEKKEKEKNNE